MDGQTGVIEGRTDRRHGGTDGQALQADELTHLLKSAKKFDERLLQFPFIGFFFMGIGSA